MVRGIDFPCVSFLHCLPHTRARESATRMLSAIRELLAKHFPDDRNP